MEPYIIEFPKIGSSDLGYISYAENPTLPFTMKRVYWTYFTPDTINRGGHAHIELEQILVAVSGSIIVNLVTMKGVNHEFILDKPHLGLFIPKLTWGTMQYSHNAVQMCIACHEFNEPDYIRDYDKFLEACKSA